MKARAGLMAAALLLAGCTLVPQYQRPVLDLPESFPGAHGKSTVSPDIRPDWWTLYNDATLNELVESALTRNADLHIAIARIEEVDANLRQANAAFLPEVDLGATGSRTRISSRAIPVFPGYPLVRNDIRIAASTSFELDFWGRLRAAAAAVRAQALGSRFARDTVELTLEGVTIQAYFALRSLDAQIHVTRETLASREKYLELVQRQAAGGLASDLDLNQAQGARADAAIQLKDLVRQRELAEHQLGVLTGRLNLQVANGDLLTLPVPPVPPPGLPSVLMARRPDVRSAEQDLIAANAQIGVARAALFPDISLTGSFGTESRALSTLLASGSSIWSPGFALNLPIFDAGRRVAGVEAAVAREHQALANYRKSAETAFREVADALTNLKQNASAERDVQTSLVAARNALRLAKLRYEAGYSSYLEVLDAQRTANTAELAAIRNRQATLDANVDLMKALGGGWSPSDVLATP